MSLIQTSLFPVIKRFPNRKDAVIWLFGESESFQIICDDYRRCGEALEHWNQSVSGEAPVRRDEYAALLWDQEAEILHILDFCNTRANSKKEASDGQMIKTGLTTFAPNT